MPGAALFVLSGSSRFQTVPTLSESLAGRAAFIDLWPLSMAEVTRGPADFLSRVFRDAGSLRRAESGRFGQRASSFGDRIHALPVSALWGHAQAEHV